MVSDGVWLDWRGTKKKKREYNRPAHVLAGREGSMPLLARGSRLGIIPNTDGPNREFIKNCWSNYRGCFFFPIFLLWGFFTADGETW